MSGPIVSVIIPTYNAARFVAHAIESALEQSLDDVEIIVVDDGSTDGTAARVGAYQPRVRYVQRPHAGPGAARNHGAELARGEWLAFLDADDFWYPCKLTEQLALTEQCPTLDVITGNYHIVDEGGRLMGEAFADHPMAGAGPRQANREGVTFGPDAAGQYVRNRFGILSTTLVRADLFRRVGGFSERFDLSEDLHLMFRLVAMGRSFGAVRVPVAAYRRRRGSTSHRRDERRHRVTIEALTDLLKHYGLAHGMAAAVREVIAETRLDLAYMLARQRRRVLATMAAGRALVGWPSWRAVRTLVSVNMPVREGPSRTRLDRVDPVEMFRFGVTV